MGFIKNKKKTPLASASSIASQQDRFNEKASYESLYDEYNNKPSSKAEEAPPESRDEEPTRPGAKKTSGLARASKELDMAAAAAAASDDPNPAKKSPIKEITSIKKKKKRRTTSRRQRSESFDDSSFSSVSSSSSSEGEETDLSYEESYTEDEISETSTNLESFSEEVAHHPDHQAIVQVEQHGNVEKLRLEMLRIRPTAPTPTSVVIKIEASSITLQDCMIRRGKWYEMQSLPFVPGSDVVGTIHEIGDEAVRIGGYKVGDRVAAVVPSGGNAKYITVDFQQMIRVPEHTDPIVALSLSSTYVPARQALDLARKMNTPFTGANILVIGGNGPSGLATIELAGLEGANVYATADERHHEYLTALGAKCFPIDPKKWLPILKGKMDVVVDSVCLDGFESSASALNDEGTLICTGMSALYTQGNIPAFGLRDIRDMKAFYVKMRAKYLMKSVYYDKMERFDAAPNEYAQHFRYLCHLTSKDTIKPIISARASLNMIAFMHRAIEHGDAPYGVCVCTPWITKNDL